MIADTPPAIVVPAPVVLAKAAQLQGPSAGPQTPPPAAPADKPGWRTRLKDKGVDLTFSYVSESAASLTGGRDGGAAYTQQLLASASIDTGKAFGLDGGKLIATIIHRKGEDLTATRLGNLFEVQELFGGGQDLRPAELSYEQKLNGGKTALKFGLYHTGDDFATLPSGCQFQNFAFCPRPTTLFYNSGFSGFPIPRWGLRVRQEIAPNLSVTVAGFEVNAFRAQTGAGWKLAPRFDSFVFPVELGLKTGQKPGGLPGLLRIGALVDTTDRADVRDDINGDSYVLSGLLPAMRQERWSAWAMGEQMIVRFGPGDRGLSLFGTLTLSSRFLDHGFGGGYQHVALTTDDIFATAKGLQDNGAAMLEIPANYHADLAARFDLDEVLAARMADDGVLYDEDGEGAGFWQMYSRAFDKLFFFEFVQRAKGYGGYGAPNAGVRLAAQNRFRPDAIPAATL